MDYFSKFKKRIAPPKAQPTSALQLVKFHKCWDYVHVRSNSGYSYKYAKYLILSTILIEYLYSRR